MVIIVEIDWEYCVFGYDLWWDVFVVEVFENFDVVEVWC